MDTRVAVISIIVENPAAIEELNHYLHEAGEYIIGRMGIPYREKGINIISIAIDAPQDMISALSGKIGRLNGVSTKTAYSNVITKAEEKAGSENPQLYPILRWHLPKKDTRSCRSAVIRRRIRPSSSDTERRFQPYWKCSNRRNRI